MESFMNENKSSFLYIFFHFFFNQAFKSFAKILHVFICEDLGSLSA